jgi:hypothetical protein
MRSFSLAVLGLLAAVSSTTTTASFSKDVLGSVAVKDTPLMLQERELNDKLLAKAMPVKDFEQKYGVSLGRKLEENADFNNYDYNKMYSFDGFSMTYAKCQPIQYFSEEAVENGARSPMMVDDIVVLRLCPAKSCSDSKEYGCYSNYAEYALSLQDYLYIMINYEIVKDQYMCEYCATCLNGNGRLLEEEQQQQEDQQNNENEYNNQQQQYDNANYNEQQEQQQDNGEEFYYDDQYYSQRACSAWNTFCTDYSSKCVNNGGQQEGGNNQQQNGYLNYQGYLNYLQCTQVNNANNGGVYFVKPRCDGTYNTIKMTTHYDANCIETSDMSVANFGLGMRDNAFRNFYSGECVSCDETVSFFWQIIPKLRGSILQTSFLTYKFIVPAFYFPQQYPPYDASSIMCNMIHGKSAPCVEHLHYDPFEIDDTTECAYIESIRDGTYDEEGTILLKSFGFAGEQITTAQKMLLAFFVSLSLGLTIYACYMHHAMTNLLIKSLSHRELLPPSRHASRRNSPRRNGRRLKKVGAESDWDDSEFA